MSHRVKREQDLSFATPGTDPAEAQISQKWEVKHFSLEDSAAPSSPIRLTSLYIVKPVIRTRRRMFTGERVCAALFYMHSTGTSIYEKPKSDDQVYEYMIHQA